MQVILGAFVDKQVVIYLRYHYNMRFLRQMLAKWWFGVCFWLVGWMWLLGYLFYATPLGLIGGGC